MTLSKAQLAAPSFAWLGILLKESNLKYNFAYPSEPGTACQLPALARVAHAGLRAVFDEPR